MRIKKKEKSIEVTRENVIKLLNDLMYEVADQGLPYDEDAQKLFDKKEFYEFNGEFRTYGMLFGIKYIEKLVNFIDNLALDKFKENKEDKEK